MKNTPFIKENALILIPWEIGRGEQHAEVLWDKKGFGVVAIKPYRHDTDPDLNMNEYKLYKHCGHELKWREVAVVKGIRLARNMAKTLFDLYKHTKPEVRNDEKFIRAHKDIIEHVMDTCIASLEKKR